MGGVNCFDPVMYLSGKHLHEKPACYHSLYILCSIQVKIDNVADNFKQAASPSDSNSIPQQTYVVIATLPDKLIGDTESEEMLTVSISDVADADGTGIGTNPVVDSSVVTSTVTGYNIVSVSVQEEKKDLVETVESTSLAEFVALPMLTDVKTIDADNNLNGDFSLFFFIFIYLKIKKICCIC